MTVSTDLQPVVVDNVTDASQVETSGTRAVELVTMPDGRMFLITSEIGTSSAGIAVYEIDADPLSPTYGQVINPAGTGQTAPLANGAGDLGGKISQLSAGSAGAGYQQVQDIVAVTTAGGTTFVYTADAAGDSIGIAQLSAGGVLTKTGALTSSTTLDFVADVSTLRIGTTTYLLARSSGASDSLISYRVDDATGALTQVSRIVDGNGTAENYLADGDGASFGFLEAYSTSTGQHFVAVSGESGLSLFLAGPDGTLVFQNARGDDQNGATETDPQGNRLTRDLLSPSGSQTGLWDVDAATWGEIDGRTYLFVGGTDDDVTIFRVDPDARGDGTFDLTLVGQADNIWSDISALRFVDGAGGPYLAIGGEQGGLKFVEIAVNPATGVVSLLTASQLVVPDAGEPGAELADSEDIALSGGVIASASDNDGGVALLKFVVCFCEGTRILTRGGYRPVESLAAGDLVLTQDHGWQVLRWIGYRDEVFGPDAEETKRPVLIPGDLFGAGLPAGDLRLSRQHRIALRADRFRHDTGSVEVLVPAKDFCGLGGIELDRSLPRTRYFHLLFDRHEIVWANGIPCESFLFGENADQFLTDAQVRWIERALPALASGRQQMARPELRGARAVAQLRAMLKPDGFSFGIQFPRMLRRALLAARDGEGGAQRAA
jgi:hypothetical protein